MANIVSELTSSVQTKCTPPDIVTYHKKLPSFEINYPLLKSLDNSVLNEIFNLANIFGEFQSGRAIIMWAIDTSLFLTHQGVYKKDLEYFFNTLRKHLMAKRSTNGEIELEQASQIAKLFLLNFLAFKNLAKKDSAGCLGLSFDRAFFSHHSEEDLGYRLSQYFLNVTLFGLKDLIRKGWTSKFNSVLLSELIRHGYFPVYHHHAKLMESKRVSEREFLSVIILFNRIISSLLDIFGNDIDIVSLRGYFMRVSKALMKQDISETKKAGNKILRDLLKLKKSTKPIGRDHLEKLLPRVV
ncbi:MAG: hypothetical protein NZT61_07610 [Deltaproteobacteria bacterium]|nr:hypothetical protein [Deltaproteobacteria bacterium]